MKSTTFVATMAVLMAAAAVLPAMAQDTETKERPNAAARMEKHKQNMDARYKEHEKNKAERRARIDAFHEQCHNRMKGAETPEQMRAVKEECMAKGKEMKDNAKAKREDRREDNKDKREDWKDKRGDMKAEREERRANRAAPAAE